MGRAYTYRCGRCGFEKQFNEGHGFLVHPQRLDEYLKIGEKLYHHKTHKVLEKLSQLNQPLLLDATFKIFRCPHCHLIYDKVAVTIYDEKKIVHTSEFRCNQCRARLKLTNIHRLKAAKCPACNHASFRLVHQKLLL